MKIQFNTKLMVAIIAIARLFALPASAAKAKVAKCGKVGGFNFLPALCVVFVSAFIGGSAFADSNRTLLHLSAAQGQTASAHALVKVKAGLEIQSKKGWTPLHKAIQFGHVDTALHIIKSGANVNAADSKGWMPLHLAARNGQTNIGRALIDAGAHLKAQNNGGYTPLDIARHHKHWEMVAMLEDAIAPAPAPEDGNVAERVFKSAWRSVVYVETEYKQGSGVIVKPDIVATNCHVVEDGGKIVVYASKDRRTDKSTKYRARIHRSNEKEDFCLLRVSGLKGAPANVRRYDTLQVGESVYAIGAPKGFDLSITEGIISQKRKDEYGHLIQTDVDISRGSSGGGLFDRDGNLIGITTLKIEGINFAIPADLALSWD